MGKYTGTIIGIHETNKNISISFDLEAKEAPLNVSFKDFGAAMIGKVEQYGTVEFEAQAIGHPFIIRNGVKTSERVKNPRARNFKLLAYNSPADNLDWGDDEEAYDPAFNPTEG